MLVLLLLWVARRIRRRLVRKEWLSTVRSPAVNIYAMTFLQQQSSQPRKMGIKRHLKYLDDILAIKNFRLAEPLVLNLMVLFPVNARQHERPHTK